MQKRFLSKNVTWILIGVSLTAAVLLILAFTQQSEKSNEDTSRNSLLNVVSRLKNAQTLYLDNTVPITYRDAITDQLEDAHLSQTEDANEADILVSFTHKKDSEDSLTEVYVPVTNFSSLKDSITTNDLLQTTSVYVLAEDEATVSDLVDTTLTPVETMQDIITTLGKNDIAIIPFDRLSPELKVLMLDGLNILDKEVVDTKWPLTAYSNTVVKNDRYQTQLDELLQQIPASNRKKETLSSVVFTGVTAISRGVEAAITSHGNDPLFPARGVMEELSKADITHIDNENPLFEGCEPETEGIVLCGKARSIAALKAVGADVIDLTGNHQNDYGTAKNLESIQLFEDAGFEYFGGGKNREDAGKILYKTVNETTFGFVGYNYFDSLNGPEYVSLAKEDSPGANYFSDEKLKADVAEARENADIVIVDYQFIETYSYTPLDVQKEVFRQSIDYGADIVVGVQSHQPQSIEFYNGKLIFYGLGNFFFDQMWSYETRQGIIPRLTFSNGKLSSVELLTTLLYEYGQPRFTQGEERTQLLETVLP